MRDFVIHKTGFFSAPFYQILLHAPLGRRLRLPMIVLTTPTRVLNSPMVGPPASTSVPAGVIAICFNWFACKQLLISNEMIEQGVSFNINVWIFWLVLSSLCQLLTKLQRLVWRFSSWSWSSFSSLKSFWSSRSLCSRSLQQSSFFQW